jgi:beta-galactosidase
VTPASTALTLTLSRAGILVVLLLGAACESRYVQPASARTLVALDDGWKFTLQQGPGAEAEEVGDDDWQNVRLPHTWNAQDGQDGGNDQHRGTGWYRRRLTIPEAERGKRFFLQFDGASLVADVFVNGTHVGQHRGGFARFRFDITASVRLGQSNLIAVRVNNAVAADVPPVSGDFSFFGGLYRQVHLLTTDPIHVDAQDFGSSGVYLTPGEVTGTSAALEVRVKLTNDQRLPRTVSVDAVVVRADQTIATTLRGQQELAPGASTELRLVGRVDQVRLWDGRVDPYLYTAHVELREGGVVRDVVAQRFGFRQIAIDANNGLSLNGRPLGVRGVIRHQDRQDRGWAISAADQQQDVALITEMGANAVRLAHYQHASLFHDLCDEAGVLVWSELGLVNAALPGQDFSANARQQLQELIRQNYNHPSIFVWGLANELVDFNLAAPVPLLTDLNTLAHAEDATRPTTLASHVPEAFPINDQTDLVGFNKYYGWYYGKLDDLGPWADKIHAAYPQRRLALSEYGAGAGAAIHSDTPRAGDHSEEYQALYHEASWRALAARPFLWGSFITFMFDLASDARDEGEQAGRNDKGLVTYDRRTRKDAFYFYKANWSSQPFVHITSRRFEPRLWAAPGDEARVDVRIYSNGARVSLTVNGSPHPGPSAESGQNHVFVFPGVRLEPGVNHLKATATGFPSTEVTVSDTITWTRAETPPQGPPAPPPVALSRPCSTLTADGPRLSFPTPPGPVPETTGGTLLDGDYLLTGGFNLTTITGQGLSKLRVSGSGTRVEVIEKMEPQPARTAAGSFVTAGNTLVRTFTCPGPSTQVQRYTATPTGLVLVSNPNVVSVYTRQ